MLTDVYLSYSICRQTSVLEWEASGNGLSTCMTHVPIISTPVVGLFRYRLFFDRQVEESSVGHGTIYWRPLGRDSMLEFALISFGCSLCYLLFTFRIVFCIVQM
jgi:hypothetical protein